MAIIMIAAWRNPLALPHSAFANAQRYTVRMRHRPGDYQAATLGLVHCLYGRRGALGSVYCFNYRGFRFWGWRFRLRWPFRPI